MFKVQKNLFKYGLEQGRANKAKAYLFGDSRDETLTQKFLQLLLQHHVNVHELNDNATINGKKFEKGKAYLIPSEQPNFLIVHSLFEENILQDSIYYDNTGWSVIHAYGLQYAPVTSNIAKGERVTATPESKGSVQGGISNLAYISSYTDYNATKALYALLQNGLLVKTTFKPFTALVGSEKKAFGRGSLVIPVAGQNMSPDSLHRLLQTVAQTAGVRFTSVATGFSAEGIDLGSSNIKAVRKPEVALAFGQGVTASEAGQIWLLLNQQLGLPVTKLDLQNFERASLKRYNTLILPAGNYSAWNKGTIEKIKSWVADGGTLITLQNASAWAVQNELANEKLVQDTSPGTSAGGRPAPVAASRPARPVQQTAFGQSSNDAETPKAEPAVPAKKEATRLDFAQQQDVEGAKRINGAIFTADLDTTHPLAFGINDRKLYVNKNSSTFLQSSSNKYATVALYDAKPFVNGYASQENIKKVSNSAAILVSPSGAGQVVLFADDPTYRGYWLGTNRIFLNSIFFANLIGGTRSFAAEAEEAHE